MKEIILQWTSLQMPLHLSKLSANSHPEVLFWDTFKETVTSTKAHDSTMAQTAADDGAASLNTIFDYVTVLIKNNELIKHDFCHFFWKKRYRICSKLLCSILPFLSVSSTF